MMFIGGGVYYYLKMGKVKMIDVISTHYLSELNIDKFQKQLYCIMVVVVVYPLP